MKHPIIPIVAGLCILTQAHAAPSLVIDAAKSTGNVSPTLYGLMTEEINYSYDGGLYGEAIRNRAFLDNAKDPVHWSAFQQGSASAAIALDPDQPLNDVIKTSLRVNVSGASASAPAGVSNDGYWGIPVKPSATYRVSFMARAAQGFSGHVTVSIVSEDGATVYAKTRGPGLSADWKSYSMTLKTHKDASPTAKAKFVVSVDQPGTIWLSLVSLFPPTWKDQLNGFRPDILQKLVDLNPKFLRLPGGNYLEGDTVDTRFDWKKTIGPIDQRIGHPSPWGYRSTDGLGLMEFLRWCEDMNAEPVLAVYAGYSLKGQHVNPGPDLQPFVQDALDEIEYVSGPATSKWGAERAKDGHAKPFPLHYVEIGNEDWFDKSGSYDARFVQFSEAIRAKYPDLKLISTYDSYRQHGPNAKPDLFDDHYYRTVDEFLKDAGHYDHYDRSAPKIFVGEWAAHESSFPPWDKRSGALPPTPNMRAALGDAAWMAGLERNSDVVLMNCYAPLFVNVNGRQWRPDLIGYDALDSYGSPSYYAFRLFSTHVGDEILGGTVADSSVITSVTRDSKKGIIYVKLVNPTADSQQLQIRVDGVNSLKDTAEVQTLAADPTATNSLSEPTKVVPMDTQVPGIKPSFTYTVAPNSITVLQLHAK